MPKKATYQSITFSVPIIRIPTQIFPLSILLSFYYYLLFSMFLSLSLAHLFSLLFLLPIITGLLHGFFRKTFCKYSSATISIQPHSALIVIFVIVTYQQQVKITPFHKQISITSANSMAQCYSSNADNYSASQEVTGFSVK